QKFAVRVQANPEALAAMGIGIDDLRSAVAAANSNTPVGNLDGPAQNVTLQASGSLPTAEQYRPIIVAYRNGAPIRLGQVATVAATIIPALALPVSLIGTFAGMYVMGYSIDNLSLLAITLSVGFVVDDAIVMLENIVRHIEDGMRPMEAALKGSAEIGFTILSITLSLVAVFIPV